MRLSLAVKAIDEYSCSNMRLPGSQKLCSFNRIKFSLHICLPWVSPAQKKKKQNKLLFLLYAGKNDLYPTYLLVSLTRLLTNLPAIATFSRSVKDHYLTRLLLRSVAGQPLFACVPAGETVTPLEIWQGVR